MTSFREPPDYFAVLGLPRSATNEEIRDARRRWAGLIHPDLQRDKEFAEERLKRINEACDVLTDPQRRARWESARAAYEREAAQPSPPQSPSAWSNVKTTSAQFSPVVTLRQRSRRRRWLWSLATVVVALLIVSHVATSGGSSGTSSSGSTGNSGNAGNTGTAGSNSGLRGYGDTVSGFKATFGLDLQGCPARTCYGSEYKSGGADVPQFQVTSTDGTGRVIELEHNLPDGTPLEGAESEALAIFPADSHMTSSFYDSSPGCYVINIQSPTLGQYLSRTDPNGVASISLDTAFANGNQGYDTSNINTAIDHPVATLQGQGCG
jgi:hypothetical protein